MDIVTLTVKEIPVYFTLKEFPFQRNAIRTVVIAFPDLPPVPGREGERRNNGHSPWGFVNRVINKTKSHEHNDWIKQ